MATITIGTLDLVEPVWCYDWSALFEVPPQRGANRAIPGVAGRAPRPRVVDEARVALQMDVTGVDLDDVYANLGLLRALAMVADPQAFAFVWGGGTVNTVCVVEAVTAPAFRGSYAARCALDITLPDGPLVLT